MQLSKLKLIFISSLVVLVIVFIATFYLIPSQLNLPESKNIQIIETEDEWILQYDIFNNSDNDIAYEILATADGNTFSDRPLVKSGREYTYILHIPHEQITSGEVTFIVYQEGRQEPIEQASYQLKTD
jgi:hypothetical protein